VAMSRTSEAEGVPAKSKIALVSKRGPKRALEMNLKPYSMDALNAQRVSSRWRLGSPGLRPIDFVYIGRP
jgi:hypothetical protein